MSFTLTFAWWWIPTIVTILALLWAFFWPADRDGIAGGMTLIIMLVPALFVIAVAWAVAGIFFK